MKLSRGAAIQRRSTATRCMALLVGLHFKEGRRISREELAAKLRRSVRTVHSVLKRLESLGWIEVSGGGNGTPGLIIVLNDLSWKTADVADDRRKTADDCSKTADDWRALNLKVVIQGKERALPSKPVENPYADEWARIQRFAAERGLPLNNGADIDAAAVLMESEILRKPPESETSLQAAQVYR